VSRWPAVSLGTAIEVEIAEEIEGLRAALTAE
jgi:hypothetical protein